MLELDGTDNKSHLGANAILAVSLACSRAAATTLNMPLYAYLGDGRVLPVPFMNVINGGEHAGNELAIQEHMIAPVGATSLHQAVQMCSEVYHTLKTMLAKTYGKRGTNVGDEGGFAPPMRTTEEALDAVIAAIEEHGYEREVRLALDAAASSFYQNGRYQTPTPMTSDELLEYYRELATAYPLLSIEDPFDEDDWDGFVKITHALGDHVQIVGDDLFVTTATLVKKGIDLHACNAMLLKPNQIGTLTECQTVAELCHRHKYGIMVSHRSGDTCDSFIADLVVALGTGQIKSGAPCRSERTAKYNRLLAIEQACADTAPYGLAEKIDLFK
jgi:enolase